ncbi:MAG: hypothetical protein GC168_09805 [Candidatus Hydrogenedens sp.]|nr:hypothetical protein [Candidatus Hydrogenedens sp.]
MTRALTRRIGWLLAWSAVLAWFGGAPLHLVLHPDHGGGAEAESHQHDHCHAHTEAEHAALGGARVAPAPSCGDAHFDAHACALCVAASSPVLPAAATRPLSWREAPCVVHADAVFIGFNAERLPFTRRGPPVLA